MKNKINNLIDKKVEVWTEFCMIKGILKKYATGYRVIGQAKLRFDIENINVATTTRQNPIIILKIRR